jgi:prepilin-type N-terminal cleavage/methylation domain-containing protein/prepilin-type processing-associated H-X9-DG protein
MFQPSIISASHDRKRSAFTLLELLVVIAIIGLLAAILFPVFGRVRENARRTSCLSNMNQLGLAMVQYTQDFDETFPLTSWTPAGCAAMTWRQALYPYVKSVQVYKCPSNTYNTLDTAQTSACYDNPAPALPRNYALNMRFLPSWTNPPLPLRMPGINDPASRIFCAENSSGDSRTFFMNWNASNFVGYVYNNGKFGGHLQMMNFIFADGHAKAMRPMATVSPVSMWGYSNDNPASCNVSFYAQLNCTSQSGYQVTEMSNLENAWQ